MKWKATSAYHAISDCGRYHVSRARIGYRDYYDSWFGSLAAGNMRHLHSSCDKQAAIQACVDDANKLQQPRRVAAHQEHSP